MYFNYDVYVRCVYVYVFACIQAKSFAAAAITTTTITSLVWVCVRFFFTFWYNSLNRFIPLWRFLYIYFAFVPIVEIEWVHFRCFCIFAWMLRFCCMPTANVYATQSQYYTTTYSAKHLKLSAMPNAVTKGHFLLFGRRKTIIRSFETRNVMVSVLSVVWT